MKKQINRLLNWFEEKFNSIIELLAFIGGLFCILFAIFMFVMSLFGSQWIREFPFEIIILPGIIGFFGVIILFALRITRHLTK
jgi:hypothetical protein